MVPGYGEGDQWSGGRGDVSVGVVTNRAQRCCGEVVAQLKGERARQSGADDREADGKVF